VRAFLLSSGAVLAGPLPRRRAAGRRGVVDALPRLLARDGQWIPNVHGGNEHLEAIDFLRRFNDEVATDYPGVRTFAEESTAWAGVTQPVHREGGLGFDFKWDLGWMHDTLAYFQQDPSTVGGTSRPADLPVGVRGQRAFCLPLSHDEVSHGKGSLLDKMPGDDWQQRANLRLLLGPPVHHPGQEAVFMGTEFGQRGDWDVEGQLDWPLLDDADHAALLRWTADLPPPTATCRRCTRDDHAATASSGSMPPTEEQSVVSYLRRAPDHDDVLVVCNLTPSRGHAYRIGVPRRDVLARGAQLRRGALRRQRHATNGGRPVSGGRPDETCRLGRARPPVLPRPDRAPPLGSSCSPTSCRPVTAQRSRVNTTPLESFSVIGPPR
jgi:1,4-alpha-glucan branching enzyme